VDKIPEPQDIVVLVFAISRISRTYEAKNIVGLVDKKYLTPGMAGK